MVWRFNRGSLCLTGLVASLVACSSGAESPTMPNPMLERWCEAHPCDWDHQGKIKQVGTWHPDDYAVELVSDDAAISQFRAELDSTQAKCFAFSLMAHIAHDAHAYVELDFLDDGEVEFSERIPASNWDVRTFTVTTPTWYRGVRFIVRKAGPGQVVVAEFNAELMRNRCSVTPLPLNDRPVAASCENDEQCASGSCPISGLSDGGTCD
jgi:hypothetical protein